MDNQPTEHLSGPDFLDQVADNENGDGRHINGAEYRSRAKQWREDRAALQAANDAVAALEQRLAAATQALAA